MKRASAQLDFEALLVKTDEANSVRTLERKAAHLPTSMHEGVPFFRGLLKRHHAAMLAADLASITAIKDEAELLALKLNGFEYGYLADVDSSGCMLDRLTRAPKDTVPLWGQSGSFEITIGTTRVRIDMEGLYGIAGSCCVWPGLFAHAVRRDEPFISETGYRSFLGLGGDLVPGLTPDAFARAVVEQHIKRAMKGKLVAIKPEYRMSRRARSGPARGST
ncbi:hypothetical protein [uncultured Bradyrhizobium sp.]|jgi:hypothetical protein|uniref:hypothetical protein n=1 Tax=uncultured Bradyrhizobium sp. TaxID=199684 RepID=UPI002635F77B|nr:hypothetical protein [uncultured Bradyrhizobium sp.]